jgi:hypothetical protein
VLTELDDINALANDLKKLTLSGDHLETYAGLTGIRHDASSIAKKYYIRFIRMDLNRILYK